MRRTMLALLVTVGLVVELAPAANAVTVRWTKRVGRAAVDVASAPDGSIYVVSTDSRSITVAATLHKYDAQGNLRWSRHWLPFPHASTHAVGVAIAENGTIYMLGLARGQCEGEGWFVRAFAPGGELRWKYVTPGWATCGLAEAASDIDVQGDLVVVSGTSFGCCSDMFHDGWVQSFSAALQRRWRANVEPPAPTPHSWFDTATGVSIGDGGGIYASGWAATRGGITEMTPTPGTPILEKLTSNGGRVWSRRASVSMPTMFLPVSVATGGNGVVIAAGIKGKGAGWGQSPTTGWVASYSTAGSRKWQRAFGGGTETAAAPTGVAIGFTGLLWVIGTQRDATDHGTDVFVRTYAPHGNLVDKLRIDAAKRLLTSGGIDDRGTGAVATGWLGDEYRTHGGRVWRLAI